MQHNLSDQNLGAPSDVEIDEEFAAFTQSLKNDKTDPRAHQRGEQILTGFNDNRSAAIQQNQNPAMQNAEDIRDKEMQDAKDIRDKMRNKRHSALTRINEEDTHELDTLEIQPAGERKRGVPVTPEKASLAPMVEPYNPRNPYNNSQIEKHVGGSTPEGDQYTCDSRKLLSTLGPMPGGPLSNDDSDDDLFPQAAKPSSSSSTPWRTTLQLIGYRALRVLNCTSNNP